jgi:hypothetical protein
MALLPDTVGGIELVEDVKNADAFGKQPDVQTLFNGFVAARALKGTNEATVLIGRINERFVGAFTITPWVQIGQQLCQFQSVKSVKTVTIGGHESIKSTCFFVGDVLAVDLGDGVYVAVWSTGSKALGEKIVGQLP